jgi:tripartite-type tricarboxylate transporter receptor subunit TctC
MKRSYFIRAAAGLAWLAAAATGLAQDTAWPTRSVTIVVPVPPGSSTDIPAPDRREAGGIA